MYPIYICIQDTFIYYIKPIQLSSLMQWKSYQFRMYTQKIFLDCRQNVGYFLECRLLFRMQVTFQNVHTEDILRLQVECRLIFRMYYIQATFQIVLQSAHIEGILRLQFRIQGLLFRMYYRYIGYFLDRILGCSGTWFRVQVQGLDCMVLGFRLYFRMQWHLVRERNVNTFFQPSPHRLVQLPTVKNKISKNPFSNRGRIASSSSQLLCRVQTTFYGLRFRVQATVQVWNLLFMVQGLWFMVQALGFMVLFPPRMLGIGFRVQAYTHA